MRLHHLRSGRGSTSGVQEDTLGLLGGNKRHQRAAGDHRGAPGQPPVPKGRSLPQGIHLPAALVQPRGQSKFREVERNSAGSWSDFIRAHPAPVWDQPQQKPQQLKHKPQSQHSPDCIPHSLAKQATKAQQTTDTDTTLGCNFPHKSCCLSFWFKWQQGGT